MSSVSQTRTSLRTNNLKKISALATVTTALILLSTADLGGQTITARDTAYLDSVFRANSHPVSLQQGSLTGPGADFLVNASRDAQFFVLGESHYVAEIPPFGEALFARLHRESGYNYYGVEFGPAIVRMLSGRGVRGDAAKTFSLARKYPHAFQFWDDEEIAAFAGIGQLSTTRSQPMWGLDNEWGALHALDRLVEIAQTDDAREVARRLSERARAVEATRPFAPVDPKRFISDVDSLAFDSMRIAFHPRAGSEAAFLIDALETSNRLYLLDRAAGQGETTGFRANADRERYMKELFMKQYRSAQRSGDASPRVLVKVGSGHGGNWRSATYVQTLGNFLHEFAQSNGSTSFHLVAWLVNEPGTYWSLGDDAAYLLLARAGSTAGSTIVDLRPLRGLWYAGKLRALSPQLRDTMLGYDAVLLLGSGTRGTYQRLRMR